MQKKIFHKIDARSKGVVSTKIKTLASKRSQTKSIKENPHQAKMGNSNRPSGRSQSSDSKSNKANCGKLGRIFEKVYRRFKSGQTDEEMSDRFECPTIKQECPSSGVNAKTLLFYLSLTLQQNKLVSMQVFFRPVQYLRDRMEPTRVKQLVVQGNIHGIYPWPFQQILN